MFPLSNFNEILFYMLGINGTKRMCVFFVLFSIVSILVRSMDVEPLKH